MQTISAKELRDNLDSIVRRVRSGERIRVTYRSKMAFTLEPEATDPSKPKPGTPEAMRAWLASAATHRKTISAAAFDPAKSAKQLYHELLDTDPAHQPPAQQ